MALDTAEAQMRAAVAEEKAANASIKKCAIHALVGSSGCDLVGSDNHHHFQVGAAPTSARRARRDARYCSVRCRVAVHRDRGQPLPAVYWYGPTRSVRGEDSLGQALLRIAHEDDEGAPKTGRRSYYLALSHGGILVDMSATDAGKKSRDRGYKQVNNALGRLRSTGSCLSTPGQHSRRQI